MSIIVQGDAELIKDLERKARSLSPPVVRKIITKASKPLVTAARQGVTPLGRDKHRYSTPKLSGKLKAPKGYGKIVATYASGNLQRAIRKLPLRKAGRTVVIGPKAQRRNHKGRFAGNRVDGYYAHMVEGGTKYASAKPFMEPAWRATRSQVIAGINKDLSKHINNA